MQTKGTTGHSKQGHPKMTKGDRKSISRNNFQRAVSTTWNSLESILDQYYTRINPNSNSFRWLRMFSQRSKVIACGRANVASQPWKLESGIKVWYRLCCPTCVFHCLYSIIPRADNIKLCPLARKLGCVRSTKMPRIPVCLMIFDLFVSFACLSRCSRTCYFMLMWLEVPVRLLAHLAVPRWRLTTKESFKARTLIGLARTARLGFKNERMTRDATWCNLMQPFSKHSKGKVAPVQKANSIRTALF